MPILLYRLLLPLYVALSLPGWLVKMVRRGGLGTGLLERASCYREDPEFEPYGAVLVHAVSVGETMLAVKLIRVWASRSPGRRFVLGVCTATGHEVARRAAIEGLRVVYQPVDFRFLVDRYLRRFGPSQLVLVEGEMWPNLLAACRRRGIPVRLVNARMSPRSRRRYRRFASWIRPVFGQLDRVAVQEEEDAGIWTELGVPPDRVTVTGSVKFDPGEGGRPQRREAFSAMLGACAGERPVVLAASTHAGEEALIGRAVVACGAFYLCVPRHAERGGEVATALAGEGFEVVRRSDFSPPADRAVACLLVDTTGELRDWTAHADVVVIGKSFLGVGGQNPAEAVAAGRPLVFGPHMENFEPLASRLVEAGGARRVDGGLAAALGELLSSPTEARAMAAAASGVLRRHEGAVARTISLLEEEGRRA